MTNEPSGGVCEPAPLDSIFDRVTDGVFALDTEWTFTYLNDRARDVVRDASDGAGNELVGQHIWECLPDARGTPFETESRAAMERQEPTTFEMHSDSLDQWFEIRLYPSETGLTVWFCDITERRQKRARLEAREAVLREMYDVISDQDASFEERVDDLLRIGQEVLGTEYGTLSRVRDDEYVFEVVRSPGTLEAGDVVDLSATNCERVVLTEETLTLANLATEAPELTDRAGFTEWGIRCYLGTPVTVEDEVYGTFCFYDTEPREDPFSDWEVTLVDLMGRWVSTALERELVEERLRRQNDRLEEFATLVSHDLRNPLNVADGWLDIAREEGDSEALEKIADSHERLRAIIDDVLTLARAGRTIDDPSPLDVAQVATDAWTQVQTGDTTLAVDVDPAFDAHGDPQRLQQLFENLFRNCVEHGASEDGTLAVRVGTVSGGFYVEDDGVGIPTADREHVLDFGYTTAEDGTGLGLGAVEDIASAHGWSVAVTESAAGGARFEFTNVS
ncbi:ATP-binding protein [Haloplanus sp. C73]|uniref:sensor histidine kinase n=1 Tax=Haloplanus sp. C73 TaxID=3421641 RepID=UPI003EBAA3D7